MSMTQQTIPAIEQAPVTATSVVNAAPPLGWLDIAVAAAIFVVAVWYLYRNLLPKRGQCTGCSSQGKGSCAVNRSDPPKAR